MSAAAEVTEPRNNAARAPLVAFFSRGRGSGHVVPDMEIIDLLAESGVRCTVKSITYGTGAAVMRERGREHIDLGLPDENPFLETQLRVTRTVARLKPDLVIAREEYAAMPAARLLGVPGIFITDYFVSQQHLWMQCLAYANEILFIDNAGTFEEPDYLKARTVYCGPFVRRFAYTVADRQRARQELGIPISAKFLTVLPGRWFTEERMPVLELVAEACGKLPAPAPWLTWIAGDDFELVSRRFAGFPNIKVQRSEQLIDRLMVAADVVITKGTRKTSLESAALGIPSISLSAGLNRSMRLAYGAYPVTLRSMCAQPALLTSQRQSSVYASPPAWQ